MLIACSDGSFYSPMQLAVKVLEDPSASADAFGIAADHLVRAHDCVRDANFRTVQRQVEEARDERRIQEEVKVAVEAAEASVDNLRKVAEPLVAESKTWDMQELGPVLNTVEEAGATSKAKAANCLTLVSKHFGEDARSFGKFKGILKQLQVRIKVCMSSTDGVLRDAAKETEKCSKREVAKKEAEKASGDFNMYEGTSEEALSQAEIIKHASVYGVGIKVKMLSDREHVSKVPLSCSYVDSLTGGVRPQSTYDLQSGVLSPLRGGKAFHLMRWSAGGERMFIVCSGCAWFNFIDKCWMDMRQLKHYASSVKVLYLAFRPEDFCSGQMLFCKVGFHDLRGEKMSSIIGYVEKKTKKLQLTNVQQAGIFCFPVPNRYACLADPSRAGESSLKHHVRHHEKLLFVPTGDQGETDTFSSSLEYFRAQSNDPLMTTMQVLTQAVRDFTSDATLVPRRAIATKCRLLSQRPAAMKKLAAKKLVTWIPGPDRDGRCDLSDSSAEQPSPEIPQQVLVPLMTRSLKRRHSSLAG